MDKYAYLRAALPVLIEEARLKGGVNSRAQMIIDLLAERDRLLEDMQLIAETDAVDAALDPQRAIRVARAALAQEVHDAD